MRGGRKHRAKRGTRPTGSATSYACLRCAVVSLTYPRALLRGAIRRILWLDPFRLIAEFTFIILLSAITSLVAYACSMASLLLLKWKARLELSGARLVNALAVALLALLYSLWAIAGSGREAILWGGVLLLAGVPVYAGVRRGSNS